MQQPVSVGVKIDTTKLVKGIDAASAYTKRTMPELVNTALYWVARNASGRTPKVTPAKIDTELAVISQPVVGRSGKVLKRKRAFFGKVGTANQEVPLAVLIVAARSKPGSRFNQLTKGRYALPSWPFKGLPRRAGAWLMASIVDKMIKARHKSGAFLRAGWQPSIDALRPLAKAKFARGGSVADEAHAMFRAGLLGSAKPASEGQPTGMIENNVGGRGVNSESHNRALNLYGGPALQAACDEEGQKNLDYALKKMGQELAVETNQNWK